jgi:hypothetical protein
MSLQPKIRLNWRAKYVHFSRNHGDGTLSNG